jgi:predicted Zn-dependent protease
MTTHRKSLLLALLLCFVVPTTVPAKDAEKTEKTEKVGKRDPKSQKEDIEAIGDRDVGKGMNFYSLEKEIALGKSLAQQVERNARLVEDPVIAEYINRVGQNLVRNSDAKVPFTIKLVDAEEVNAFALPGGFFFVNSGLVLRAESESELAGVMAHEIAHVAARHGTRQATRGQVINLASIPLIFMGGWTGYGIRQAAGFAIPLGFMKFSRGMEEEADFLGLQYLYKSGYDPTAFTDFFEKLKADQKRKPGTMSKLFASHPPAGARIKKTQKSIDELLPSRPEYVVNTSEFLQVRDRLQSVVRRSKPEEDPNKPTLRRTTTGGTVPSDEAEGEASGDAKDKDKDQEDEERPTLKRR